MRQISRSDGKVTIDIVVNGKTITKEIDNVERLFVQLGKNADTAMKNVGNSLGNNTEAGAKTANKAVDSVEKSVSSLGQTAESSSAKAGAAIGNNFDSGAKEANQATNSITKSVADLTATTSTELAKTGRIMGESFGAGSKDANNANDSVEKSVNQLLSSVESASPKFGQEIGTSFSSGAKEASGALDGIGKSSSSLLSSIEASASSAGNSLGESFDSGSKRATRATDSIGKSVAQMVPQVEISATKAGKSIASSLEAGAKNGARSISDAVESMKKDLVSVGNEASQVGSKIQAGFVQPEPSANKLTSSIGDLSVAMLLSKGAASALAMTKGSLDGAFGRIDTLDNFQRTMTRVTGSSTEAQAGMEGVRDAVVGTSYTLDGAAQTVQRLVLQNGSLERSTKSYEIWGDAVALYGDGSAETMQNVMDAIIQMRATGTVNMAQMDRIVRRGIDPWHIYAEASGMSIGEVRDALKDGVIGAEEFFDTIEVAMREGRGAVVSVAGAAREAGNTWAGSFANMATATARGTANIITSVDNAFSETRFGSMKENVQGFGKTFEDSLNGVARVIPPVVSAIDNLVGGVVDLAQASPAANAAIIGLTGAIVGYMVVKRAELYTRAYITSIKTLTGAKTAAAAVTKTLTVAEKSHLDAAATSKATMAGSAAAAKTYTVATTALTAAKTALAMATSGVGLAIGAAVAIGAVLFKRWNDNRKAAKEFASELDGLKDDLDSLEKSTESSVSGFEAQEKVIASNAERHRSLATELQRLSAIENKSAADKKMLADTVDALNDSVTGLNLSYDEETGALNATTQEIEKRIEASRGMEEVNRLTERQQQLSQESAEIETKLAEVAKERARIEWEASTSGVDGKKAVKESLDGLLEKEAELQGKLVEHQSEKESLYESEMALRQEVANTTASANAMMIDSYNGLSDSQKAALDSMNSMYKSLVETSTDAFQTIEQNEAISLENMIDNLRKNAEAMQSWSTNVALLAEAGVSDGIIMQLEKMGPAGAQQAALLVEQTGAGLEALPDEGRKRIEALNEAMGASMGEAMDSTARIAGEKSEDVAEKIGMIPEQAETSLQAQFEGRNFSEWGRRVPEEFAEGQEEGLNQVKQASEKLADTPAEIIGPKVSEVGYSELGSQVSTNFGSGILDHLEPIESASKEVAEIPGRILGEVITPESFAPSGEAIGAGMAEGIMSSKERIQASLDELSVIPKTNLESAITPEQYTESGRNIGTGLVQGINFGTLDVENATRTMAENANNAFKVAVGINSPSTIYRGFGENIAQGAVQGINSGSNAVVDAVRQMCSRMEQEARNSVQNMSLNFDNVVTGAENSLRNLPNVATRNMSAMNSSFQSGAQTQQATMRTLNNNIIQTFSNTPSQFQNIGRNMMSRMNSAISSESSRILTTTRNTANRIVQSFNQTPNQMQAAGRNGMAGLNAGLSAGSGAPVSTASRTRSAIVSNFSGLPSQMSGVGQSAMSGLNAGLNAGSGAVMATANRIANQVTSTIRRALDINSPSRVMANDVGQWIPKGIASGIEKYAGTAYQAIDNLSAGMLRISTPEMALGASQMGRELAKENVNQTIINRSSTIDMPALAQLIESRPVRVESYLNGEVVSQEVDRSIGNRAKRHSYAGGVSFA
ncbi:tape measure protein [Enterococcus faecium]|nr:tape measure protein [Enterococcus faecium]